MGTRAAAASDPEDAEPGAMEPATFPAVYERYFAFVWRTLRGLGVPAASLDDAAQDVFVVVHRKLGELASRAALASWLFGIARRVAQDYRRHRRRHPEEAAVSIELADPRGDGPLEAAARAEAAAVLARLLDGLDDDKRAVFLLVDVEELPVPRAAELLGLPLATVYSRLRAARQAFDRAVARLVGKENQP